MLGPIVRPRLASPLAEIFLNFVRRRRGVLSSDSTVSFGGGRLAISLIFASHSAVLACGPYAEFMAVRTACESAARSAPICSSRSCRKYGNGGACARVVFDRLIEKSPAAVEHRAIEHRVIVKHDSQPQIGAEHPHRIVRFASQLLDERANSSARPLRNSPHDLSVQPKRHSSVTNRSGGATSFAARASIRAGNQLSPRWAGAFQRDDEGE